MRTILVCGGRDFTDKEFLYDTLDNINDISVIISGCARGADSLAIDWAESRGVPVERYPALWDVHGRSAGPIRNQLMLDDGEPDLVVAFPGGSGTDHMVSIAKKAGVEVIEY